MSESQWDEAARKAAEDIDNITNDGEFLNADQTESIIAKHFADLRSTYDVLLKQLNGYKDGCTKLADALTQEAQRLRNIETQVDESVRFQISQCICVLEGRASLLKSRVQASETYPLVQSAIERSKG